MLMPLKLIRNIDMQRQFEINVKLIKKASDLDSAGAKGGPVALVQAWHIFAL